MKKQINEIDLEIEIKQTQIADFAQFIDVLEAIEDLKSIKQVRENIKIRKKFLQEDINKMQGTIEQMENKKSKSEKI